MPDVFERPRTSEECLSAWKISCLALDELPAEETDEAQKHVQQCHHCSSRLEREAEGIEASRYERLPEALTSLDERRPKVDWSQFWKPAGVLAASAAVVLVVVAVPRQKETGIRIKGEVPISVAIMRGGKVHTDEAPIETIESLRPGDQLRLKVLAGNSAWVVLQGWEAGNWVDYYSDWLPLEQWLPVGIEVTADGATKLKVMVCRTKPQVGQIEQRAEQGQCRVRLVER